MSRKSSTTLSRFVARVDPEGARTGSPVLVRVSSLVKAYVPVVGKGEPATSEAVERSYLVGKKYL